MQEYILFIPRNDIHGKSFFGIFSCMLGMSIV